MNIYKFKIYGHEYETKVVRREDDEIVVSVNGQEYKAYLQPTRRQTLAKATPKLERPKVVPGEDTKKTAPPTETKGAGVVKAPLPGLILKVLVKPGDVVKSGQTVLVMEAMKMQNNIACATDGVVATVVVTEGASVLEGQEMVTINPA